MIRMKKDTYGLVLGRLLIEGLFGQVNSKREMNEKFFYDPNKVNYLEEAKKIAKDGTYTPQEVMLIFKCIAIATASPECEEIAKQYEKIEKQVE